MTRNSILEKIYIARERLLEEHAGDLAAYIRSANRRLEESGHQEAQIKQRTIRCTEAADRRSPTTEVMPPPLGDR